VRDGGPRVRRGNVRAAILALLAERPMHGYEMIQELEARTDGLSRPSPGSIYSTLQLLEDEELVTREESEGKHGQASDMYASDAVGKQQGPDLALQSQADGGIRTLDPRFTSQLRGGKRRVLRGPRRASMPCKFACFEIRMGNGRTRGFST
jgi:DNA-binding PadR family transcriptional regulator